MKFHIRKVYRLRGILLLLLLAVPAGPAGAETFQTSAGLEIRFDKLPDNYLDIQNHLKELDRQLVRAFRGGRSSRSIPCRLIIRENQAALWELNVADGAVELALGADFLRWRDDPGAIRAIAGAIQLARLGINPENQLEKFPGWIADGLLHKLRIARDEIKVLNVSYYPGLRFLLLSGAMPDFTRELELSDAARAVGGAFYELHQEIAAFMLEQFYLNGSTADNLLGDLTILAVQGYGPEQAFNATLGRVLLKKIPANVETAELNDADKIQYYLAAQADQRVFNQYNPLPMEEFQRRFNAIRRFRYQPENGSEALTADLVALPKLFDAEPGCRLLPGVIAGELSALGNRSGIALQLLLSRMAAAVTSINRAPAVSVEQELTRLIGLVESEVKRQRQLETYLDGMEAEIVTPNRYFARELEIVRQPEDILSRNMLQYIDETEKSFLEE